MGLERYRIGNIEFSSYTDEELLLFLSEAIAQGKKISLSHPNAHFVVEAEHNKEFTDCLRWYSYVQADGCGVYAAAKFLYPRQKYLKSIQTGTDFYPKLLELANKNCYSIYFLGSTEKVLLALAERIRIKYPNIKIAGYHHGYFDIRDRSVVEKINSVHPNILLIGMGVPRQEFWLYDNFDDLSVSVAITVGAGIEFISGVKKRAPKIFQSLGLEWFFRLLQEPRRLWRRYLLGIPKFLYIVLRQKITQ